MTSNQDLRREHVLVAISERALRHAQFRPGEAVILAASFDLELGPRRQQADRRAGAARTLYAALGSALGEARAQSRLGKIALGRRAPSEARACFHAALRVFRAHGDLCGEADTLAGLGMLAHSTGDRSEAWALRERALTLHRRVGDRSLEGIALLNLAYMSLERGDWARGEELARAALTVHRAIGDRRFQILALCNLAPALAVHGRESSAAELAREALTLAVDVGRYAHALAWMVLAAVDGIGGRVSESRAALDAARALLDDAAPGALATTLHVTEGFLHLALARGAAADGELDALRAHRAEVDRRTRPDPARLADETGDVRVVRRILRGAFEGEDGVPSSTTTRDDAWSLVVGDGGRWFKGARTPRVDLAHRPTLARVLASLVAAWHERRGEPLTTQELFTKVWPGQRIAAASANKRVWVAIASLRRLGLRSCLLRRDAGYLLDPAIRIRPPASFGSRPSDDLNVVQRCSPRPRASS